MKKITPTTSVNYELFGRAAALPGMILARDWLSAQIEALQGEIAAGDVPGQFIPGVRASMKGLRRGTDAYRAADNHNKAILRDARRATKPTPDEDDVLLSTTGLKRGSRAWLDVQSHNARIYYRRKHSAPKDGTRAAQSEGGKKGRRNSWLGLSKAARKAKISALQAGKVRAAEARLVNGVA